MKPVCFCSAYRFPHRMGSGKCTTHPSDQLCDGCGQPAEEVEVDYGIGAYEYWGSRGFHRDVRTVTRCCEAAAIANTHSRKEWFTEETPKII